MQHLGISCTSGGSSSSIRDGDEERRRRQPQPSQSSCCCLLSGVDLLSDLVREDRISSDPESGVWKENEQPNTQAVHACRSTAAAASPLLPPLLPSVSRKRGEFLLFSSSFFLPPSLSPSLSLSLPLDERRRENDCRRREQGISGCNAVAVVVRRRRSFLAHMTRGSSD